MITNEWDDSVHCVILSSTPLETRLPPRMFAPFLRNAEKSQEPSCPVEKKPRALPRLPCPGSPRTFPRGLRWLARAIADNFHEITSIFETDLGISPGEKKGEGHSFRARREIQPPQRIDQASARGTLRHSSRTGRSPLRSSSWGSSPPLRPPLGPPARWTVLRRSRWVVWVMQTAS